MDARIISSELVGEFSQYKLTSWETRHGTTHWMVEDAEKPDEFGLPSVIRQGDTREEVLAGLI